MNICIVLVLNVDRITALVQCLTVFDVCTCGTGAAVRGLRTETQNAKRLLLPRLQQTCLRGESPAVTLGPTATPSTLHPLFPSPRLTFAVRNVERRIKEYNGTISEVIWAEAAIPGTAEVSEAIFFYSLIMAENERRVKNILHSFFHPRTDPGR